MQNDRRWKKCKLNKTQAQLVHYNVNTTATLKVAASGWSMAVFGLGIRIVVTNHLDSPVS